jgi:UDP-N-acetylmuramate dehydrogenase
MSTDLRSRLEALAKQLTPADARWHEPLAPYTTFRIGGPADLFVQSATHDHLARTVLAARELDIPYFVLGLGANVLVGDKGFRGVVVRNVAKRHEFRPQGDTCHLWTESGAVVKELIQDAVAQGWSGLEHYVGIPSTVGGAIWQNLHFLSPAPERERTVFIAEIFESCEILDAEGVRRIVGPDYVEFGYDDSVFHHRPDIVLSAVFRLGRGDSTVMQRIMQENLSWRGGKHPWLDWHPSAGSVFKKIAGVGAGRLIDECGLKGARIGDAQVSVMHANIIINLGHATAADVRALIARIQTTVDDRLGQRLETEIGMIGEF